MIVEREAAVTVPLLMSSEQPALTLDWAAEMVASEHGLPEQMPVTQVWIDQR